MSAHYTFFMVTVPLAGVQWGRWSHVKQAMSMFSTLSKCAADSDIPPIFSISAEQWKQNIGVTSSSEVNICLIGSQFGSSPSKKSHVLSIQEVNPEQESSIVKYRLTMTTLFCFDIFRWLFWSFSAQLKVSTG